MKRIPIALLGSALGLLLACLTACSSPYKVHKKPAKMTAKPLIGIHLKKSDCNCH